MVPVVQPEHVSGAENGAERAENQVKRSVTWSGRDRKRWSGSGAGVAERERGI